MEKIKKIEKKVPVKEFDYPKQINKFTALFRVEM